MAEIIEIGVPIEEIEERKERVAKAKRFEEPDRVPVMPAIAHRFLVPQTSVGFREYYSDPETMLRTQILAQKWLMENVRTDAHSITGAWVGAWTDFQNTFEAGSLGCEVIFPDDDIPWVGRGWVKTEDDLARLGEMDFVHSGLNARQVEYRHARMRSISSDCVNVAWLSLVTSSYIVGKTPNSRHRPPQPSIAFNVANTPASLSAAG